MGPRVIHHDHRPVRQITDGLMRFAAFFHEIELKLVARLDNNSTEYAELKVQTTGTAVITLSRTRTSGA